MTGRVPGRGRDSSGGRNAGGASIREDDVYVVTGYHAVVESLRSGRIQVREVWISRKTQSARTRELVRLAESLGVSVHFRTAEELFRLVGETAHQGVVAFARGFRYADPEEILGLAREHSEEGLIAVADHITDEGNLGAIIRTAAFFGANGLILPKDRSARITARVFKRAAGACSVLPVARVVNLGRTLDFFKEQGFWIIGSAGDGAVSVHAFDWQRDLAVILGNEERGMSPAVRKRCHEVVRIPARGQVESLNVAVAAGVVFAEISRNREGRERPSPP